jgi:hypothetical protein
MSYYDDFREQLSQCLACGALCDGDVCDEFCYAHMEWLEREREENNPEGPICADCGEPFTPNQQDTVCDACDDAAIRQAYKEME